MTLAELIEELRNVPAEYSNYQVMGISDIDGGWEEINRIKVEDKQVHID